MTEVAPSSPSRFWRHKKQFLGLVGEICPHCEHKIYPPRDVCPNCGDGPRSSIIGIAEAKTTADLSQAIATATMVSTMNVG